MADEEREWLEDDGTDRSDDPPRNSIHASMGSADK